MLKNPQHHNHVVISLYPVRIMMMVFLVVPLYTVQLSLSFQLPYLPLLNHYVKYSAKGCCYIARRTALAASIITTTVAEEVLTELPSFISDSVFGDIASQVQSRVKIPPIPSPIIRFILTQALQSMSKDLSVTLVCQVEELLDSEKTSTKDDDLPADDVAKLSQAIATELVNKKIIDVPMIDRKQEHEILVQILNVVFQILTTSESERRATMIRQVQNFLAHDLLGTKEGRQLLVQRMNVALDIPLFNEQQEERIITVAVEACAKTLQTLFPPDLLRTLTGETNHNNLIEMKQFLILKVNEAVDLVGLNEQQEENLIRTMVDVLIESYVDPTAAEVLLLHHKGNVDKEKVKIPIVEQIANYENDAAAIQRKIDLSTTRYEREQTNLKSQLLVVQGHIQELVEQGKQQQ